MTIINADLKHRILEISHKHKLSHIGSCITAVDIIKSIYDKKQKSDPFVLSSGHAGLALYVVLEKFGYGNAEELFIKHGVHPNRDINHGIWCSTGSLGQGLPIALGMAFAKSSQVYCLISDGECAEGSIWESLNIIEKYQLENIHVYVNANEWGAYDSVDSSNLSRKIGVFHLPNRINFERTDCSYLPFLQGQDAHYHVMTEEEYTQAMEILS